MRYELIEFQEKAARELASNMCDLMERYDKRGKIGSCCLAAPTGSGKTVVAAAVIEAVIEGNSAWNVTADPDACVLWVTDLPSLADQTRLRLLEATDIDPSRIESIVNTFTTNHTELERGQVYFLHRQLLGKNRKLTGGGESLSFWQLLRDTVSSGTHLYLFLDEAHRGLSTKKPNAKQVSQDQTIYAQIIDGEKGDSPVPVVVGISATPKRFVQAMANRLDRTSEPTTTVSPADVQASGLLKDDIILRSPVNATAAEHIYLTDACAALRDSEVRWAGWCALNKVAPAVVPLMVVQVPDKVSVSRLGELVRDIRTALPSLGTDAFAHVFGEHDSIDAGGITIPYVSPEYVEESREVRVLFAKEAVSTGWDCPRAEVIYSMRPHKDVTYITQLIGRMVRTPLARRVDDDRLNSVHCYLPNFDEKSVKQVVGYLTSEDSVDWSGISEDSGRNVYLDPVNVEWDHGLGIDQAFISIRRRIESHHPENFVLASYEYSSSLASCGITKKEFTDVKRRLLKSLRDAIDIYKEEYDAAVAELSVVKSGEYRLRMYDGDSVSVTTLTAKADALAIRSARVRADRILTTELTNAFFRSERSRHKNDPKKKSDQEINVMIAAAASVPEIVDRVVGDAHAEVNRLVGFYWQDVSGLTAADKAKFDAVLSANGVDRVEHLSIPESDLQDRQHDRFVLHALSEASSGDAWLKLNKVEHDVVSREMKRGCKAFYRNPSSGTGSHVLAVVYQHPDGGHRHMHPDFIFFEMDGDVMRPSIVDPHWTVAAEEAKAKLVGLARYAEEFGSDFCRIWSVNGDGSRYIDLLDKRSRDDVLASADPIDKMYELIGHAYN